MIGPELRQALEERAIGPVNGGQLERRLDQVLVVGGGFLLPVAPFGGHLPAQLDDARQGFG